MNQELYDCIRTSKAEQNGPYTHVTFYSPVSKVYIKSNEQGTFWKKYCDLADGSKVCEKNKLNLGLCLGEKQQDAMPLIVRATLKFQNDENFEMFDDDFILGIVYCYQQSIMEILEISDKGTELLCCVLKADVNSYIDNHVLVHFSLHFPYCKTESVVQTRAIRPRVIQYLRSSNVVSKLPTQPVNDWETILDPLSIADAVPLYRSVKNPDTPELLLYKIYGGIENNDVGYKCTKEYDLSDVFDPSCHSCSTKGLIPMSTFSGDDTDHDYWLPMFLSIDYWHTTTVPKDKILSEIYNVGKSASASSMGLMGSSMFATNSNEETNMDICEILLGMLNREKIENEHTWLEIGKSLYTESKKSGDLQKGLTSWIHFTEKSDVHTSDECTMIYPSFELENSLSIKTIAWYAKKDSKEAYESWHEAWSLPALDKALSGDHSDVSEALYRMYWLEFVCSSAGKKEWYHFKDHRWFKLDNGITLRQLISGDFRNKFERLSTSLGQRRQDSGNDKEKEILGNQITKIEALIKKLKSVPFKANIMKDSIEKFHDANFDKFIDSNPNLIGLFNGVIETSQSHAYVRDGKPEDYISKSCNIFWRSDFHDKHPVVERCMKWLRQVFTDSTLLHYVLKIFASCLRARNSDKLFPIFTGDGDNSKSMLKKLFEATFGSYCTTFPTSLFTTKRSSSSAPSPEVAQSKSARICFLQEPDADDPFKNGTLKELTGGDSFFCRMLNDNGGMIQAMFKLFLMCNKVPLIPNSDKAVKNRLRIVPFLSTWVDNAPPTEQEQFKCKMFQKDPFFEKQIPELAPAFMWILVKYFEKYIEEKLQEPQIIKDHTEEYWKDNDLYQQFISEKIKPAQVTRSDGKMEADINATLTFNEVLAEFKFWFTETFGRGNSSNVKMPDRGSIKYELTQRLGKIGKNGWVGVKIEQQPVQKAAFLFS